MILRAYEDASGQCINFTKSSISFSHAVSKEAKLVTEEALNLSLQMGVGKYLGLLSLIGHEKKEVFAYLCERVWKKTRAWKANLLSWVGREVLIKSMAQSMQTYAMSIFMPPISPCDEIQKMFNAFWWCGVERRGN